MTARIFALSRLRFEEQNCTSIPSTTIRKCGTSRNVLTMLRQAGEEPVVVGYLKNALSRQKLVSLIEAMGISPRALLRRKGTPYDERALGDEKWSDEDLSDFMIAHPILINRPIVETPHGTRLCRPSETVLDLLPEGVVSEITKEDGELVGKAPRS